MPILVIILAVAVSVAAGFFAVSAVPLNLFVVTGCVLVSVFAFFSPKLSLVLLVFSMLLSPEMGFGTGSAVLRYDDILLVVIFFSWLARTAVFKGKSFITSTPVQTPVLIYTAVAVVSTGLAILRGDVRAEVAVFYVLKYIEYFLLYFMSVNILDSSEDIKRCLKYAAIVAVLVTLYAYYYYFSAGPDARASAPFEAPLGNPRDSEPASLGGYYLLVFGILFSLLTESSGAVFIVAGIGILFMFPAFLLTFSRASYIGFVFMMVSQIFSAQKRKALLIVCLLAGFAGVLSMQGLSKKVKERVEMTYSGQYAVYPVKFMGVEIVLEESAYARYNAMRYTFQRWLPRHPILGNGVTGAGLGDNQYARVLSELGLVGFFVFCWMLYRVYVTARSVYKSYNEPWIKALALGLMVALVGLLAQSLGVNSFIIVRIMEPFWFLTAIIMKLHLQSKVKHGNQIRTV